jgi:hypothetical protein
VPASCTMLAPAFRDVELTRTGERELRLRFAGGSMLSVPRRAGLWGVWIGLNHWFTDLWRDPAIESRPGDTARRDGFTSEVTDVAEDGLPSEVSLRFDRSLDDARYAWYRWDWERNVHVPVAMPAVGGAALVPGVPEPPP